MLMFAAQRFKLFDRADPQPLIAAKCQMLRHRHHLVPVIARFAMVDVKDVNQAAFTVRDHRCRVNSARCDLAVIKTSVLIGFKPVARLVIVAQKILPPVGMTEEAQEVLIADRLKIGTRSSSLPVVNGVL